MKQSGSGDSPAEFFVKAAWAAMWNPSSDYYLPGVIKNGIDKSGVKVDALGNLDLGTVPSSGSFQIMKSHNLEHWLPVKTGYIGIVFDSVTADKLGSVSNGGISYTDGGDNKGSIEAKIGLPAIQISGNYTLVATGLAQCAADTAGIIPAGNSESLGATADETTTDDNPYLEAARAQRTRLWQTPNGGQLMDKFYDHNEPYNYTLQNNPALKSSWGSDTNQHFLNSTYESTKSPDSTNVNDGSYQSTSYNTNAFNQQVALTFSCLGYANNPPADTNITKEQFTAAANAAQNFTGPVGDTGNTNSKTTPMTIDEVYSTVQKGPQTDATLLAKSNPQPLKTQEDFLKILSKEHHEYLASIGAFDEPKAADSASSEDASKTMLTGTFTVTISGGDLTMDADLTFTTSPELKATAKVTSFESSLQISSVDITNQNTAWGGLPSIGGELIQKYAQSNQIPSLMQDKANDQLDSDKVKDYISTWINNTFQKVFGNF